MKQGLWFTDSSPAVMLIRAHAFTGRKKTIFITLLLGFLGVVAAHIWMFGTQYTGRSLSCNIWITCGKSVLFSVHRTGYTSGKQWMLWSWQGIRTWRRECLCTSSTGWGECLINIPSSIYLINSRSPYSLFSSVKSHFSVKPINIPNSQLGSFLLDLLAMIIVIVVCVLVIVASWSKLTFCLSTVSKYAVLKAPWVEHFWSKVRLETSSFAIYCLSKLLCAQVHSHFALFH